MIDPIRSIVDEFVTSDEAAFEVVELRMAEEIFRLRQQVAASHTHTIRDGGIWVVYGSENYYFISAHDDELEAYKKCVQEHGHGVIFLPFGISLHDAIRAQQDAAKNR